MTSDAKLWAWFWVALTVVASFLIWGAFTTVQRTNAQNTERDKYYAAHCTIVRETLNVNSTSSNRDYACKGDK